MEFGPTEKYRTFKELVHILCIHRLSSLKYLPDSLFNMLQWYEVSYWP